MADFTMFSGDTKVLNITLTDEAGAPVDVSSIDITWQLHKKVTSPALLTKTVGSGISITDGPAGKFQIALDPIDTAGLKGDYYHEIQISDAGAISTVLTGAVTIQRDAIP